MMKTQKLDTGMKYLRLINSNDADGLKKRKDSD